MRATLIITALIGHAAFFSRAEAAASVKATVPRHATVEVGGRSIVLPFPEGFDRIDGRDPEADRLANTTLPAANRYLARFDLSATANLQTRIANVGRDFSVQVLRSLENREIGERTFAEFKQQTQAELDKMKATIGQELEKQLGTASKRMGDELGVDAALSVSDVAILGCFGDSPSSLGFTMALKVAAKVGSQSNSAKRVIASMIVPINGRLVYLYANGDLKSPDDRQSVEKAVTDWRDAVLAANPRIEGPAGFAFDFASVARASLIGVIVGGCIGGLVMLFKKLRKA